MREGGGIVNSWWKRAFVGAVSTALLGALLALALGYESPAQGATPTTFSITVNNSSSAAVDFGTAATLAETGLPADATGTVTFSTPTNPDLCQTTLPAIQCASPVSQAPGNYQVTAAYSGDGTYAASNSTNTVNLTTLAPTTTVVSATPSSGPEGTSITYSATVTSSYSTPTGVVNFRTPAKGLCQATLVGDVASCAATTAPVGVTTITGLYLGDGTSGRSFGMTKVTILRATPSLACSRLSGKASTSIKFSLCTPFSTLNRTARAPGSLLSSGGTITWIRSAQTSVVSLTSTSPGQGACPRNFVEHDLSGDVTGGSSVYTLPGDPVSIRLCENARYAVRLVTGTTANL
jgi:Bacterial Ig-like domain (group 3)